MCNSCLYVDLKRIIKRFRCGGMSDADVLFEVAEILKYELYDDGECVE